MRGIMITFSGEKFDIDMLSLSELSNYKINIIQKYNVISKRGRYRGQLSPYGLCTIHTIESELHNLFNILCNCPDIIVKSKLKEIEIAYKPKYDTYPIINYVKEKKFDKILSKKLSFINSILVKNTGRNSKNFFKIKRTINKLIYKNKKK